MTTTYGAYEWVFDFEKWAAAVASIPQTDRDALAELFGIVPDTIRTWTQKKGTGVADWPRMENMLKVCNYLEIDPASMFKLKKIEVKK